MFKKIIVAVATLATSIGMAVAAVNINTASEKELEALPGIGPAKAKAIVDYRKKNGNFKAADDLKKVDGIGDKTFDDIKGQISLSGATKEEKKPAAEGAKKEEKPAAKK